MSNQQLSGQSNRSDAEEERDERLQQQEQSASKQKEEMQQHQVTEQIFEPVRAEVVKARHGADDGPSGGQGKGQEVTMQNMQVYNDFKQFPHSKWEPYNDPERCPPGSYCDVRGLDISEQLDRLHKGGAKKPMQFDLQNTWLKGEQYAHILQNQDRYCQTFGVQKYDQKMHPESIYIDPQDGLLYFVEGATIGSDFGFPRLGIRKRFKWKKMNFTTDLPKKDPLVSYIVASAVKCEKFFPGSNNDGPVYRMHAVILKKRCAALQLPPLDFKTSKNDSQQSQENDNAQDADSKQQPRSLHGRVLTQSRKMKAAFGGDSSPTGAPGVQNSPGQIGQTQEKNYILCHVRRVVAKEQDDESMNQLNTITKLNSHGHNHHQASKIPNKLPKAQDQIKANKVDLKIVKNMTPEELAAAKLTTIGPDGKPKLLSAYKQKKLLLAQQQKHNPDLIQIDQGPVKRNKKRNAKDDVEQVLKDAQRERSNSKQESSYTDQSRSGKGSAYIDNTSSNNVSAPNQQPVLKNPQQQSSNQQNQPQQQGQDMAQPQQLQDSSPYLAVNNLQNTVQGLYGFNNLGLAGALGNINNLGVFAQNNFPQFGAQNSLNQIWAANQNLNALAATQVGGQLQQQLLGLGNNLGINNLNLAGINGFGNLGNLGALSGIQNMNGILGFNNLNNMNALALQNLQQQALLSNPQLVALQQQQQLNIESQPARKNSSGNKKRDVKYQQKQESIDTKALSPMLPIGNIGSLISGQNPGGLVMGSGQSQNPRKKQATDGSINMADKDLAELANDLNNLCAKEYTRRLSGHQVQSNSNQQQEDNNGSPNGSPKSNKFLTTVSNFIKSPAIPGNQIKIPSNVAELVGGQLAASKSQRKSSLFSNPFGQRERLNSAFKKYDSDDKNKSPVQVPAEAPNRSPLTKGKQGEPSFGADSKQGSGSCQNGPNNNRQSGHSGDQGGSESYIHTPDHLPIKRDGNGEGARHAEPNIEVDDVENGQKEEKRAGGDQYNQMLQLQLLQQQQQQNQYQNLLQNNFQNNLSAAVNSGNQFLLMNPNFQQNDTNTASGNGSSQPKKSADNAAAAAQLQLLQQQSLYNQQFNYLSLIQQNVAPLGLGNTSNIPPNIQELIQQQQQQQQLQQQANQDMKKDCPPSQQQATQQSQNRDQSTINQQINIIQNSKFSPVLQGYFMNQSFGNNASLNSVSNAGNPREQSQPQKRSSDESVNPLINQIHKPNNQASHSNKHSTTHSPVLKFKSRHDTNKQTAFLSQIQNALAATPGTNTANERQAAGLNHQNPSFTIPFPNMNNQTSHKESWIGSFGNYGRKSTENILPGRQSARQSFSLGQEQGSSTTNNVGASGMGLNNHHKFSLTGTFFNNSYNNYNNKKYSGKWDRPSISDAPKSPGKASGGNDEPSSGGTDQQKKDRLSRQLSRQTSTANAKNGPQPTSSRNGQGNDSRHNSPFEGSLMGNLNNTGGSSTFITPLLKGHSRKESNIDN